MDNATDPNGNGIRLGSIKSSFQFSSYKVDSLKLEIKKELALLELTGGIDPSLWDFKVAIRPPTFFKNKKYYVGGINAKLLLYPKVMTAEEKKTSEALVKMDAGIAGIFNISDDVDRFPPEVEKQLAFTQMPGILLPYLRATMTTLLASAGFGSVNIPLINIQKFAKDSLKDVEIKVVE